MFQTHQPGGGLSGDLDSTFQIPYGKVQPMQCITRAWTDTFRLLGGWGLVFAVLAIPIVGFGLHAYLQGPEAMTPEFQIWLIYGLASTGLVFTVIYVWNLVLAPYRIERDAHAETKSKLAKIEAQIPKQAASRKLSAENRLAITSFLSDAPTKPPHLNVIFHANDEATDFAISIGDAIRSANIDCLVHDGFWFDRDPLDRGIVVYRTSESEMRSLAENLCKLIASLGFCCETREINHEEPIIFLYIARQSEP